MAWISGNPIDDAHDHIRDLEALEHEYQHACHTCNEGFDSGYTLEEFSFCNECIEGNQHIEYLRDVVKLDDTDTLHFLKWLKPTK